MTNNKQTVREAIGELEMYIDGDEATGLITEPAQMLLKTIHTALDNLCDKAALIEMLEGMKVDPAMDSGELAANNAHDAAIKNVEEI